MKSARFARGMKGQGEKGFTLVELITVVAIISLLVVYITIEIGRSNDDAKVGVSTTFLLSNVPAAISSYKARNMNSCAALATSADVKADLVARGLVPETTWGELWTVAYNHGARLVTITYQTTGSDDPVLAARDIIANLTGQPQINSVTAHNGTATNVVVDYDCV